jgi:hypothetical protein
MKAYQPGRIPDSEEVVNLDIPILVESSWMASVRYNGERATLDVELRSGEIYQYLSVPLEIFQAFLQAESLGGYFNRHIRRQFHCILLRQA